MDRIIVLSSGVAIAQTHLLERTKAVVAAKMHVEDAKLIARVLCIPFVSTHETFALSAQALRFPPTRRAVRAEGLALYPALECDWVAHSSWPLARGTCAALTTAYVLATSLGVKRIEYFLARRNDVAPMSLTFLEKLKSHAITLSFSS